VCVLGLCLLLNACAASLPAVDSGVAAPTAWQYAERDAAQLNNSAGGRNSAARN